MPRTPEQNKEIREKTRGQILDSALKLFATKGYHGTSVADIAKQAGVSKGLAYNYFESKQALAEELVNVLLNMGDDVLSQINNIPDPFEQLHSMIGYTFDYLKDNPEYWRLYSSFLLQPEIMDLSIDKFREFMRINFDVLENILRQMGVKYPAEEARVVGALIDGIPLHYFFDPEKYPLEKMLEYLKKRYSREAIEYLK